MNPRFLLIPFFIAVCLSPLLAQYEIGLTIFHQKENSFTSSDLKMIENPNEHIEFGLNYQRQRPRMLFQAGITYFSKQNVRVGLYSSGGTMHSGLSTTTASARMNYAYLGIHISPLFKILYTKQKLFQLYLGPSLQVDYKTHDEEYAHYRRKKTTSSAWRTYQVSTKESWEAFNAADVRMTYSMLMLKLVPRVHLKPFVIQGEIAAGWTVESQRFTDNDGWSEYYEPKSGKMVRFTLGFVYAFPQKTHKNE